LRLQHPEAFGQALRGGDLPRHFAVVVAEEGERVELRSESDRVETAAERVLDRLARLLGAAERGVDPGEVAVRQRLVWREADRGAVLLDRLVVIAALLEGAGEVRVRHEVARVGLAPDLVGLDGLLDRALDDRRVAGGDVETLRLADAIAHRVGPG